MLRFTGSFSDRASSNILRTPDTSTALQRSANHVSGITENLGIRGQRTEIRRQKTENRDTEDRGQRTHAECYTSTSYTTTLPAPAAAHFKPSALKAIPRVNRLTSLPLATSQNVTSAVPALNARSGLVEGLVHRQ